MSSVPEAYLEVSPRPWSAPDLGSQSPPAAAAPAPTSPDDAAEQIIAEAQAAAAALLQQARDEAERLRAHARDAGLAEAQATLEQERARLAAQLEAAQAEINAERERFLSQAEPEILKLSFAIAEKIIAQEVSQRPEIVVGIIRKSIRRIKDKTGLRLRVNPEDLQLVREARADLIASVDGVEHMEVTDDRRVGRGGCVVESASGTLDARIATQLRELERTIAQAASHESEHHGD